MNSLSLRISKSGKKVCKNASDIPAVRFPREIMDYFGYKDDEYNNFFMSTSYDQLDNLKAIICSQIEKKCRDDLVHFLAVCFIEAPCKHPVKGFVMRHVLKAEKAYQDTFSKYLSGEIEKLASVGGTDFLGEMMAIFKMSKCIEFDIGVAALEMAADGAVNFFKGTLQMALVHLGKRESSPSLKKDITNHCHETLRLFLLIIQRFQICGCKEIIIFDGNTRICMKSILLNNEMPMDTKSLCGIVLVRALVLEVGEVKALKAVFGLEETWIVDFRCNDTEVLVTYSALVTKPTLNWTRLNIGAEPAVIKVLDDVVAIGDRSSSDATITLSVARTIYQLSKYLGTIDKRFPDGGPMNGPDDINPNEAHSDSVPIGAGTKDSVDQDNVNKDSLRQDSVHEGQIVNHPTGCIPKTSRTKASVHKNIDPIGAGTKDSVHENSSPIVSRPSGCIPKNRHVKFDIPIDTVTKNSVSNNGNSKDSSPTVTDTIDHALAEKLVVYVQTVIDHSMDSVRYLAGQTLQQIAKFYNKNNDYVKLNDIMGNSNQPIKRSYFLIAENVISDLDESPLRLVLLIIKKCVVGLYTQEVQAIASACLESIISKCSNGRDEYLSMILSLLLTHLQDAIKFKFVDPPVLEIYDRVITKILAVGGQQRAIPILQKVNQVDGLKNTFISDQDLIAVLVLMRALQKLPSSHVRRDVIVGDRDYVVLQAAAIHPKEEYRFLSLSVVIESKKTTKFFKQLDFSFILHFLKYNINAQSPNFRQLITSFMKKLIQRLADSFYVILRERCGFEEIYADFVSALRSLCIESLRQGANTNRRCTALQIVFWLDTMNLPNTRTFSDDDVALLLPCLEDSYESNKLLAYETLLHCPAELLEEHTYSVSLSLPELLQEASSVKPSDCTSAAYKLLLVEQKFSYTEGPQNILQLLLSKLKLELEEAQKDILKASTSGPMYGLIHCLRKIMKSIRNYKSKAFIDDLIRTCLEVSKTVAPIVKNSSPEGYLPINVETLSPDDEEPRTPLEDGESTDANHLSSQMVLLCSWRSVKEVSLLFGELTSYLANGEDGRPWLISLHQVKDIGNNFISLLSETKHRGAFEQAYVGFTHLVSRLWASQLPLLHTLPATWLSDVMAEISSQRNQLCPTRRSAGLPYIIQALVTTELQVNGNGRYLHLSMNWLLANADSSDTRWQIVEAVDDGSVSEAPTIVEQAPEEYTLRAEIRTHCLNILRALYRNTSLGEEVSSRVQEGLMVAIRCLDSGTWQERNSSTLLLNALMVRVFGVQRNKDSEKMSMRNKMSARVFLRRYPGMYQFMMKLIQYSEVMAEQRILCHSLFGVLLILERLYQSSLEGTDCNFRLSNFVDPVMRCGSSPVQPTRKLAAKAIASIVPAHQWLDHVLNTLAMVCDGGSSANHLHGILMQLCRLFENAPVITITQQDEDQLVVAIRKALHIVFPIWANHLGIKPCFVIRDEMLKMINQFSLRFDSIVFKENEIVIYIDLLTKAPRSVDPNYHFHLANLYYFSAIIHLKEIANGVTDSFKFTAAQGGLNEALKTKNIDFLNTVPCDILLADLNYILIALEKIDEDLMCDFQKNINRYFKYFSSLRQTVLAYFKNQREILYECLTKIIKETRYFECQEKALMVLNTFCDTPKRVIEGIMKCSTTSSDDVAMKLIDAIETSHEKLSYLCLEALLNLLTVELAKLELKSVLKSLRLILTKCTSNNSDEVRDLIDIFLSVNFEKLLEMNMADYSESELFEHNAILWCILMTFLEDDSESIRESAALITATVTGQPRSQLASAAGEALREHIACGVCSLEDKMALMLLMALFDFHSEVGSAYVSDAYRVFDQAEQYNVHLEEIIWTKGFVQHILLTYQKKDSTKLADYLKCIIEHPTYKQTLINLCDKNLDLYKKIRGNVPIDKKGNEYWNSKVEYLIYVLG